MNTDTQKGVDFVKGYKEFKKESVRLSDYPDVLKAVDPYNGIVYINLDALPDANIIWYLAPYWYSQECDD